MGNLQFQIYKADGTRFNNLSLRKASVESVVMSLGDKITGDVYYKDDSLVFTMQEYIEYLGVRYVLVNPPTIVREGMVSDNSDLRGMTKYSLVFYHPMYELGNMPFCDVAVTPDESKYLSESKIFNWIGKPADFVEKLNKNLEGTKWIVELGSGFPDVMRGEISEVLSFSNNFISDAIKAFYDQWEVPYIIDTVASTEPSYEQGKLFKVVFGLPSQEIYDEGSATPYVFRFGQGVGLKNNSRTPKNNKIITRIAGCGSERNIPYGYPQVRWYGNQNWDYTEYEGTISYDASGHVTNQPKSTAYPLYMGIVGGAYVKLIKHPFTRKNLMPSVYYRTLFNKVSPYLQRTISPNETQPTYSAAFNSLIAQVQSHISQGASDIEVSAFTALYNALIVAVKQEVSSTYSKHVYGSGYDGSFEMNSSRLITGSLNWDNGQTGGGEFEFDDVYAAITGYTPVSLRTNTNYSPSTVLVDYYDAENDSTHTYPNPINRNAPSFETKEFEDVYPELGQNISIVSVAPINNDLTPADSWDDTIDGDGNYLQSYFKITLPVLSFDIYACAAITEEMQINMRSGACLGCTFTVQVDWDDYKKNFYDQQGNFAPTGIQRNYEKYPDSSQGQIDIILQKDNSTFGTIMPSTYQHPVSGDYFVVLGISLPQSYITSAEARLDEKMKSYMVKNNEYYFEYPLKFDEYFLETHQNILEDIKPNSIVRFNFEGEEKQLYVKQLVVKYDNSPLPKYDITLTDEIEVVINQIGKTAGDVEKLFSMYSYLRQNKDVGNDTKSIQQQIFKSLFSVYNDNEDYTDLFLLSGLPEDQSKISIKAKFGLWTDSFLSALGLNRTSGGGGGGGATRLDGLSDVTITNPVTNQVLKYDATLNNNQGGWVNAQDTGGMTVNDMWDALATPYPPEVQKIIDLTHIPVLSSDKIPSLDASKITSGTFDANRVPNIENLNNFSTRVYDALAERPANTVLAAPNGSNGAASFRALVGDDLPTASASDKGGIKVGTGLAIAAATAILSLATSGVVAGTYTKLTVDSYGRATAGTTLVASDIPDLSGTYLSLSTGGTIGDGDYRLSVGSNGLEFRYGNTKYAELKLLNGIDGAEFHIGNDTYVDGVLYASNLYLNNSQVATQSYVDTNYVSKAFFNAIFQLQDANGTAISPNASTAAKDRLKILVGAYTDQYLSALGLNSQGGGGGGSTTLAGLSDVTITSPATGQLLKYDASANSGNGGWVNFTPNYATTGQLSSYVPLIGTSSMTGSITWRNGLAYLSVGLHTISPNDTYLFSYARGGALSPFFGIKEDGTIICSGVSVNGYDVRTTDDTYISGNTIYVGSSSLTVSGGGSSTLAGLTDVAISSAANNQVLAYKSSNSKWVNKSLTLDEVSDGTNRKLSDYLPMNGGGTITNANDYSLSLSEKAITFLYGNASSGSISLINTIDGAVFSASSNFTINGNTIWHAGNFTPSNYLPLSAGSTKPLTGDLYMSIDDDTFSIEHSLNKYKLTANNIWIVAGLDYKFGNLFEIGDNYDNYIRLNSTSIKIGYWDVDDGDIDQVVIQGNGITIDGNSVATQYWVGLQGYTSNTGTVTSITLKAGTGISLDTNNTAITTSGSRTISISSAYQTDIANGVTAYGWGNHANAGYMSISGNTYSDFSNLFVLSWGTAVNYLQGIRFGGVSDGAPFIQFYARGGQLLGTKVEYDKVTSASFVVPNESGFLKADGSVDNSTYLTSLSLGGLSNVSLSGTSNRQVLTYQSSTGTWVNKSISFPVTSVCDYQGAVSAAELASALSLSSYIKPTVVEPLADGVIAVYDSGGWVTASSSTLLSGYATQNWVKGGLSVWDSTAMSWGTLTAANGYTIALHASSSDGGDCGLAYKSGQLSMQVDGYFYQNEGQYRVLDTSDASGLSVNYATSAGTATSASSATSAGYATSAGSATSAGYSAYSYYLSPYIGDGSDDLECLKHAFSSIPKSQGVACLLRHGSHSMAYGWFLSGYEYSNAYGGWFISDYGTPSWVGVDNGTWYSATFITSNNIGSQSVSYATSAGSAGSADSATKATYDSGGNLIASRTWVQMQDYVTSSGSVSYATTAGSATDSTKLPLAGGTLTGDLAVSFQSSDVIKLKTTGGIDLKYVDGSSYISIFNGSENLYLQNGNNQYYFIHSGNIGSQSVNYATTAGSATSAGYATSAGSATSAGNADTVDNEHASAFAHVGSWNNLLCAGNEFNFISNGFSGSLWLNYQDGNRQSGASVSAYYFGNGAGGYNTTLYCGGVYKANYGSSAYVLTSDGGAVAISNLSVSYASSSGSASSATKLQTARTIWGQSFDGTGNVDGNLRVLCQADNQRIVKFLNYANSPYGLIVQSYGDGSLLLQSQRESNDNECFNLLLNSRGGNVGIGTTSPSYKLHVEGTGYFSGALSSASTITGANFQSNGVIRFSYSEPSAGVGNIYLDDDGLNITGSSLVNQVIINKDLSVEGDLFVEGYVYDDQSDIRLKNVHRYDVAPDFYSVANAPTISFYWNEYSTKKDKSLQVGSIAQYWQAILPEAIREDKKGYLCMQYDVIALLSAISVAKRVTEHERRIEALERENAMLRLELNKLKDVA